MEYVHSSVDPFYLLSAVGRGKRDDGTGDAGDVGPGHHLTVVQAGIFGTYVQWKPVMM